MLPRSSNNAPQKALIDALHDTWNRIYRHMQGSGEPNPLTVPLEAASAALGYVIDNGRFPDSLFKSEDLRDFFDRSASIAGRKLPEEHPRNPAAYIRDKIANVISYYEPNAGAGGPNSNSADGRLSFETPEAFVNAYEVLAQSMGVPEQTAPTGNRVTQAIGGAMKAVGDFVKAPENRGKVIGLTALGAAAVAGGAYWLYQRHQEKEAAQAQAAAKV